MIPHTLNLLNEAAQQYNMQRDLLPAPMLGAAEQKCAGSDPEASLSAKDFGKSHVVVSLNYCSQNGGNLYRAPYYNGNPNIGPRIIGNLDQYPCPNQDTITQQCRF